MTRQLFTQRLLRWHRTHGRHQLPWRHTADPYHILVSEIMLQQTQVERVVPKYKVFLKKFPTLQKLARSSTASVLRAWQGMGYNRRALYLKRIAETCMCEFDGKVPDTYEALRRLPGVGEYTANAVLAFAFKKPVTFSDTNIRRIFSRVYFGKNPSAVPEKRIVRAIHSVIPAKAGIQDSGSRVKPRMTSALYHGALMDFGSMMCRTKPLCSVCPMQAFCKAAPKVLTYGWQALEGRVVRSPQSAFEGSDRKIRGKILDALRNKKQVSSKTLIWQLDEPQKRIKQIFQTLLNDGLIAKKGSMFMLPP